MDKTHIKSIVESLLFVSGGPLSFDELKELLDVKIEHLQESIKELEEDYLSSHRGIYLVRFEDKIQLCTRPENFDYVKKLCSPKIRNSLSQAALETLSIIAYRQPITRAEVEQIRGVKCEKAINTLLEKKIIEEAGRLEGTGRPIIYKTTIEFLRAFGLSSLNDLPKLNDIVVEDSIDAK